MTTELSWERNIGESLAPRMKSPVATRLLGRRPRADATPRTDPASTERSGAGESPPRGLAARLAAIVERWRAAREGRVVARFAGRRWTDSTEREMLDALCDFDRRRDPFARS
jgi:hypothetical protein